MNKKTLQDNQLGANVRDCKLNAHMLVTIPGPESGQRVNSNKAKHYDEKY